jgi:hypothetical protein
VKIDNRTAYDSEDIRRVIRGVCRYDEFVPVDGAIVRVVYSRTPYRYSGWATFNGRNALSSELHGAAMLLRLPNPKHGPLSMTLAFFLVRHEVAHWRGLRHADMGDGYMKWPAADAPVPVWAGDLGTIRVVPSLPKAMNEQRERAREQHVRDMLAEHEAKLAREKRLVQKWAKKVRYYDSKKKEPLPTRMAASPTNREG